MNLSPDINRHLSWPLSSTHQNSHSLCLLHTGTLMASAYCTPELSWPLLVAHQNHGPCFCTPELMVTTHIHWNLACKLHSHCCGTLELFFQSPFFSSCLANPPLINSTKPTTTIGKYKWKPFSKKKVFFRVTCGCDIMLATGPNLKGVHTFIVKQRLTCAKIILCIEPSQIPHI